MTKRCEARADDRRWYCTRPVGHAGPHIATVGPYDPCSRVLYSWSATASAEPPITRAEYSSTGDALTAPLKARMVVAIETAICSEDGLDGQEGEAILRAVGAWPARRTDA